MSGISTRPEACEQILKQLQQLTYYDHKRAYIDKFLKHLKEWQSLSQTTAAGNGVTILDQETALKIMSIIPTSAIDTMTQDKS